MGFISGLYKALRVRNDINSVAKGKVGKRIGRRIAGKATGKLFGKMFK